MNIIKCKVRSQLTNENLESFLKLKTTSYEPNLSKLSKTIKNNASIEFSQMNVIVFFYFKYKLHCLVKFKFST